MACKHTDLLLVISLSLTEDLPDQSKAATFTCYTMTSSSH